MPYCWFSEQDEESALSVGRKRVQRILEHNIYYTYFCFRTFWFASKSKSVHFQSRIFFYANRFQFHWQLSDAFFFFFWCCFWHYLAFTLEKAMAPHSSTLAWKIPWMEEPGRLQSMGSLRVGHDWATSLSLFTVMHWRRKWQPTPVFLPGESQGWGSLVGCRLWGRTELVTTEATQQQQQLSFSL